MQMSVRKYLFWMTNTGIKTYKVTQKGEFELLKPAGKTMFDGCDLNQFFAWFHKSAAITEDEFIDFCFLSEEQMESPLLEYSYAKNSSWDKQEIAMFCEKYLNITNYEVFYRENQRFVCQSSDILKKENIKKLYVKCIPEFSIDEKEKNNTSSEETSLLCKYYLDKLKECLGDE